MSVWVTIVTSAAIGAIVSSLINMWNNSLERAAKKKELLFSKAIDMAKDRNESALEIAKLQGVGVDLHDTIVLAETYYKWLEHLFEKGKLPDDPNIQRFE